jgi:hypothetical protein
VWAFCKDPHSRPNRYNDGSEVVQRIVVACTKSRFVVSENGSNHNGEKGATGQEPAMPRPMRDRIATGK